MSETPSDPAALEPVLVRIATALERLGPQVPGPLDQLLEGGVFVWQATVGSGGGPGAAGALRPVAASRSVPLDLLLGIDEQKRRLRANVLRFAQGLPANHALLWGVRGAGKSALVKAVRADVAAAHPALALVEVMRGEIASVPGLVARLPAGARVILFIDDLSFDARDEGYKALKAVLDGGVETTLAAGAGQVLVIVTSNRRHLVARQDTGGPAAGDHRPEETSEEQISLSDRFGLWLGFHAMDQATYLDVVRAYCTRLGLDPHDPALDRAALQWAQLRGARSGRTAWQFILDRAGAKSRSIVLE
jgi:hypothetical protein